MSCDFAFSAEAFLPALHRPVAGGYRHRAKLDAGAAALTEFRTHPQGKVHMPILAAAHEADGIGLPHLGADTNAAAAQNTVLIPEGIADLLDPAAHGDVLDGPGVRRLGHEQLGNVAPQPLILSLLLRITMPSSAWRVQEVVTFERPFLTCSTMHNRQAPISEREGTWHRWGMQIPYSMAASSTLVPRGALHVGTINDHVTYSIMGHLFS